MIFELPAMLARSEDDVLQPSWSVLLFGLLALGVTIGIVDKLKSKATRQTNRASSDVHAVVGSDANASSNRSKTAPKTLRRLPNGRFASSDAVSVSASITHREWTLVGEASFPLLAQFIRNHSDCKFLDRSEPLNLWGIDQFARCKIQNEKSLKTIQQIGWAMAGGALILVMITDCGLRKTPWLTAAGPGFIGVIAIWIYVFKRREFEEQTRQVSRDLSFEEQWWAEQYANEIRTLSR